MTTRYREDVFKVSSDRIWHTLIDWGGIEDWFPEGYIEYVEIEGEGDGCVRIITAPSGDQLRERLDGADHIYLVLQLSLADPLPEGLAYYKATGRVIPINDTTCRLTWASAFKAIDDEMTEKLNGWFGAAVDAMFEGLHNKFARLERS